MIDWDDQGSLFDKVGRHIRTDPLWILVATAKQGHEGDVEDMFIVMGSGVAYGPQEIIELATRPDRKMALEPVWRPGAFEKLKNLWLRFDHWRLRSPKAPR